MATLYALLAVLAIQLARQPGSIAAVWFANALGIAFVAHAPRSRYLALGSSVAVGNLVANVACGDPLGLAIRFAIPNVSEVMLGGWLLARSGYVGRVAESPRTFLSILALGGLVPQLLGATLGAATLQASGFGSFVDVWPDWYIGSALGATVALPFAMKCLQLGARGTAQQLATLPTLAFALLAVGVALLAIGWLAHPFVLIGLSAMAAALVLPPVGSFAVCGLVGIAVASGLAFGMLATPSVVNAWHLQTYLPALLCVLPAQLLTVAREQQRRASRSLSALSSAAMDVMLFFDMDGKVQLVNRATENYWQRGAADIIGRHPTDLVPEAQRSPGMVDRVRRALAGEEVRGHVEQVFPQRGPRAMDIAYQPAFDPYGRQIGVVFTAHDVTDLLDTQRSLERTVQELRTANEGLEQFARISAHDLREPLNTILQFSDLIAQDHAAELSEPARLYFAQVRQGAWRMRTMLDDLLQFVRLEHTADLALGPVALQQTLTQVVEALQARIDERRGRVRLGALPSVTGHASLLTLLFQNLVSNALKFVPPERTPEVQVSAREEEGRVVVTVADNGIGIAAQDQAKLFAPFKRLHARRKFEGTGLGLAICRRIATALGGSIAIESEPGVGSRFVVTLPRA